MWNLTKPMTRWAVVVNGTLCAAALLALPARGQPAATQPAVGGGTTSGGATSSPATTSPAATSQPAPAEYGSNAPTAGNNPFPIEELSFDLGFDGKVDQRRVSYDNADGTNRRTHQRDRSSSFEETVGLLSRGAVIDERFLTYDIKARYGLDQQWFDESLQGLNRSENSHGTVGEYDLSFTLFPRGQFSATAYAQNLDTRIPRAFLPSLDRNRERYGVDLAYNTANLSMRLSYEHVYDKLTSRTRDLDDEEREGRDNLRFETTWQISENQSLRLEYQYEDRREQYSGGDSRFHTTRNYLVLEHTLRFGPDGRSSWETIGRFQDENGDLAQDVGELTSQLRLQHTDAFATNYRVQYLSERFAGEGTRTWRGDVGASYQFSEALSASLQTYGLRQDADRQADYSEYGGTASVDYSQVNSAGRFSARGSYTATGAQTDDGRQQAVIIGESVTFRDPLPAYLAKPDVNRYTLVVTDAQRSRIFVIGRDYVVYQIGRYTGLRRVPTGQIADRQAVLVSYTYGVGDNYTLCRNRGDWRIQQEFTGGLTPYYAGTVQEEDLSPGRARLSGARNINQHRLGVLYRQPRWSAGGEYEYNHDAVDPFQALHANGDVVLWQDERSQFDGKATSDYYWFTGTRDVEARDTFLTDLGASYRYALARNFEANASAMYRYEHDTQYGRTNGVDLTGALEWHIGYFSLRFEAEYDLLDLPKSGDDSFSFWLKLRREIPVIGKERM